MADKTLRSLNLGSGDVYFPLPIVSTDDNDKVLMVVDGEWDAAEAPVSSGEYLWTRQGMTADATETAGTATYTLTTPNTSRPSSEIEYSASAPVYNVAKKTWEMKDSTIMNLVNTDTIVPSEANVYCRLTSDPTTWYLVTAFNAGTLNTAGTCTKSMTYSTKWVSAMDEAVTYVSDDDSTKYPDGAWQGGFYYEVFSGGGNCIIDGVTITEEVKFVSVDAVENVEKSTIPYGFIYGSTVVLDGEIHILGGNGNLTGHYKWNGTSWVSVSTLPYDFSQGAAVVLDGEIHIMGGFASSPYNRHYKWNGTSWVSVSTLPYNFHDHLPAVVLDGEIHIMGSSTLGNQHYKWNGTSWVSVSTLPYFYWRSAAVVLDGEIHILGTASINNNNNTKHYKWNGTSWVSVSTLPYGFHYGSAVVMNGEIHIMGGGSSDYYTKHYKWNGTSWIEDGALPYNFSRGSAVVMNDEIHILGSDQGASTSHYLVERFYYVRN